MFIHGEVYKYGRKYQPKEWINMKPRARRIKAKKYQKHKCSEDMIIDMNVVVGHKRVYSKNGVKGKEAEITLKDLMKKYDCSCRCK